MKISLIPLFPLLGFLINGLWYGLLQTRPGAKKAGSAIPGTIATLAIFGSFVVALSTFLALTAADPSQRVVEEFLFSWMKVGAFEIDAALRVDVLSSLFCLVITGVGTLIHLYSIGYMSHDETPGKFFAYLNLFCFAMLILVMGASLPLLFFGWEGVGLCSYLLIGYWYTDIEKAKAGKKAFIVNRIGDLGFLVGMFLIFSTFQTLDFNSLRSAALATGATVSPDVLTWICIFLFIGCMGKSAQIPLYVWLPDAMAGPTPVSALIHAATMVTSGIYMVARLNFLFSASATAMTAVAVVGAATALFAATIAIVQRDIKKVLAYSTVSQLGYMFLACGVGAYTAGVFHVITHAFFKALLFLGAGSVIHGMHEEQDICKMGGLRRWMPITFGTFLIGWLAICGLPPFSGFFSKDEILWSAFSSSHGSKVLWAIAALTAVMTAFYMTRLFSLTFLGQERFTPAGHGDHAKGPARDHDHGHSHGHAVAVHESPWTLWVPLVILAVLSAMGGFMGFPHALAEFTGIHIPNLLNEWLAPVIPLHEAGGHASLSQELLLMGLSIVGAVVGIGFAFSFYRSQAGLSRAEGLGMALKPIHQALENKWYIDEIYEAVFVKPIRSLSQMLWKGFDVGVIDSFVLGFGKLASFTGQTARTFQAGSIQIYAFASVLGVLTTVGYIIYAMVR